MFIDVTFNNDTNNISTTDTETSIGRAYGEWDEKEKQ